MKLPVILILLVNLAERFCFYTINGTQLFYMQHKLDYSAQSAQSIILVLQSACYLSCLPGGVLGDKVGKYRTILFFAIAYFAGCLAVTLSTDPSVKSAPLFLIGSFAGLAIGSGGIKPNVPNFGADQIDKEEERSAFFSYFYWAINIGSAVALGFMSTLANSPTTFGIGEDWGYFVAYAIASAAMGVAAILFVSGTRAYKGKHATGKSSVMRPIMRSVVVSAKSSGRGKFALLGWVMMVPFFVLSFVQAFMTGTAGIYVGIISCSCGVVMILSLTVAHVDNSWLHLPQDLVGEAGMSEDDVQMTFQGIPMMLLANAIFNFAYSMMLGPFLVQSCQMDLNIGSVSLGGAVFNLGDCLAIIICIPIFEKFIFPGIKKCLGYEATNTQKLMAGYFFAALAMATATLFEVVRRTRDIRTPDGYMSPHDFKESTASWSCIGAGGKCTVDGGTLMGLCKVGKDTFCSPCARSQEYTVAGEKISYGIYESDMSALLMFIPFAFIGIGEILVNPTTYYYAYTVTPAKTRSVVQAINMIFQGALPPAMVSVFVTVLNKSASPNNLNNGHLEYFYYISMLVIALFAPIFFWAASTANIRMPEGEGDGDGDLRSSMVLAKVPSAVLLEGEHRNDVDGSVSLTDFGGR